MKKRDGDTLFVIFEFLLSRLRKQLQNYACGTLFQPATSCLCWEVQGTLPQSYKGPEDTQSTFSARLTRCSRSRGTQRGKRREPTHQIQPRTQLAKPLTVLLEWQRKGHAILNDTRKMCYRNFWTALQTAGRTLAVGIHLWQRSTVSFLKNSRIAQWNGATVSRKIRAGKVFAGSGARRNKATPPSALFGSCPAGEPLGRQGTGEIPMMQSIKHTGIKCKQRTAYCANAETSR